MKRQRVGEVRASYGRRPDGRVDVVNRCRTAEGETEARGVGQVVDERTFAKRRTIPGRSLRTFDVTYLAGQTYLEPHPKELMLRNHV